MTAAVIGFQPDFPGEIYWEAQVEKTGALYKGAYMTYLTFTLNVTIVPGDINKHATILVTRTDNLQPNTLSSCNETALFTCSVEEGTGGASGGASGGAESSVSTELLIAGRKPSPDRLKIDPKAIGGKLGLGRLRPDRRPKDVVSTPKQRRLEEQEKESLDQYKYDGYGQFALRGFNDTWFRSDGLGTYFEISDIDGNALFEQGTLCPHSQTYARIYEDKGDEEDIDCDLTLVDGLYIFRVTGALDPHKRYVEWDFCDVSGEAQNELYFRVQDGDCEPLVLRNVSAVCADGDVPIDSFSEKYAVVEGGLEYSAKGSLAVAESNDILHAAIVGELADATGLPISDMVVMTRVSDDEKFSHLTMPIHRLLMSFHQVTFEVRIPLHAFGLKDATDQELTTLNDKLRSHLETCMDAGVFSARVQSLAMSRRVWELQQLTYVGLTHLNVRLAKSDESMSGSLGIGVYMLLTSSLVLGVLSVAYSIQRRWKYQTSTGGHTVGYVALGSRLMAGVLADENSSHRSGSSTATVRSLIDGIS